MCQNRFLLPFCYVILNAVKDLEYISLCLQILRQAQDDTYSLWVQH